MRSPLEIARDLAEARDAAEYFSDKLDEIQQQLKAVSDPDKYGPGVRAPFLASIKFYRARRADALRRIKTLRAEKELASPRRAAL